MKFYHREPTEKLIASSNFNSLSASFCCALTLSYRPCKHLTQLLFWLLFLWADGEIPWCVFCQLVCCLPSVRRSPGKDQTVIYKSPLWWTVRVEACPAIHPSVSKSFASLFDVPAPQCCWVWCPQLFFAFIPCQSSWYQSRVCINKCSPVCLKWFCHSRTLSIPNTTTKQRSDVDMGNLEMAHTVTKESPDVFFMPCTVIGCLFQCWWQMDDNVWLWHYCHCLKFYFVEGWLLVICMETLDSACPIMSSCLKKTQTLKLLEVSPHQALAKIKKRM